MINCIVTPIKINECIRKMNNIIKMLNKAKTSLDKNKIDTAKHELTEEISESAEAIQIINYLEEHSKHVKPVECDRAGAISLTGVTDLQQGNKYITPSGAIINWVNNTITVCEHGTLQDTWRVDGAPLTLKDVTGKVQQILIPNAYIFFEDASALLVGTAVLGGTIDKARFIDSGLTTLAAFQGYPTNQTEVYANDTCKSKVAQGTVAQVFGF